MHIAVVALQLQSYSCWVHLLESQLESLLMIHPPPLY